MIRTTLVLVCCYAFVTVFANPLNNLQDDWSAYKIRYNKNWAGQEDTKRKENFQSNLEYVIKHNLEADNGSVNYRLAINKFSDLTHQEMRSRLPNINTHRISTSIHKPAYSDNLPISYNWCDYDAVGPVVDQGESGSSSVFAAIGAIEGHRVVDYGTPFTSLSTQQIIDCNKPDGSASPVDLYSDIIAQGGLETAANYPSTGQGSCKFNPASPNLTQIWGYQSPQAGDEESLKLGLYAVGPLAVLIDASSPSFQSYSSGIYEDPNCHANNPNHALLLVGYAYDCDLGEDYWVLRNSWGEGWGLSGYITLKRGVNMCGVSNYASTAILVNQ